MTASVDGLPAGGRARSTVAADRQALETLASVGQEALSRLRLGEQMARQAREDALTGLPNRALLLDRLGRAVRSASAEQPVAVLYLDLDGFKSVNDRFGHAAGDDLLRTVAARLRAHVRDGDVVARLGGDEFAVVVEQAQDEAEVTALCRRLVGAMRAEITVAEHEVVVSTSIGVAVSTPGADAALLLRQADMAMYRAKALGKNQYVRYEGSLGQERVKRLEAHRGAAPRHRARAWSCTTSRSSTCRRAAPSAWRRWCAGSAEACWCRRTSSSPPPRRAGSSCRSARGCSTRWCATPRCWSPPRVTTSTSR
ncbi:hypothetical protein GCM10025868_20840 [Angustibacter aerolatus]|uniref:GGDEF domain-containing protein n=1 Tax=Angustibacter aerolatus TaxID=1162965 RepID=A0ABQ6JGC2_9ACTN|nr:hypothetical protein GCM10025868_20840 [Angustibacter aerolatus]